MKYWLNKYYKIVVSAVSLVINTIGLVLSIYSALIGTEQTESSSYITFLLISAEVFLIISVIYTIISALNNYHNRVSIDEKNAELIRCKDANKTIYENNKAIIGYYKDFKDRLQMLVDEHLAELKNISKLEKKLNDVLPIPGDNEKPNDNYFDNQKSKIDNDLKTNLIELYNRFIINTMTLLRESIEEYLVTKGCHAPVSLAMKQLESPERYSQIDEKKMNIHTAFRDAKTYRSKTRNETWEKSFCIKKNSDFKFSIERDYYIFNFVNKALAENGFYLNENDNFYENYNSGVTCTIHLCVNKKRVLYGFLACDSLFDQATRRKCGENIYDYNVANIMMSTANIIALFLHEFLDIWNLHYIENGYYGKPDKVKSLDEAKKERNLCKIMIARAKNSRYPG